MEYPGMELLIVEDEPVIGKALRQGFREAGHNCVWAKDGDKGWELARTQQFFTILNDRLAGRQFIATDRFSIADITAVVAVDFARVVKVKPGEQHPQLQRWRAALALRPSMSL